MKHISLAHGSGGLESSELITGLIYRILGECVLDGGEDAGVWRSSGRIALSTDSYVISPLFFPGGDIGKLCVCGSSNDVAMRGARPRAISLGLIIEEGFEIAKLERILRSIADELHRGDLKLLAGDTKVVPKGTCDGIYINTTAIGELEEGVDYSVRGLQEGDCIIVSAPLGTHGAVIFSTRHEIGLESDLQSDCAQLYELVRNVRQCEIHSMRDATRGGLAAVLNEWSVATKAQIDIYEESLPILEPVRGVCEILGLDVLSLANEGVCVIAAPESAAGEIVEIFKTHALGRYATIIGRVGKVAQAGVILHTPWGAKRYVEYPQGEILPRIC